MRNYKIQYLKINWNQFPKKIGADCDLTEPAVGVYIRLWDMNPPIMSKFFIFFKNFQRLFMEVERVDSVEENEKSVLVLREKVARELLES